MPEKATQQRVEKDRREGKAPSTQAGEFVHEEIEHVREGKHGARSAKQAIAIGLSKARRAGVELPPPKEGTASKSTRAKASKDVAAGKAPKRKPSAKRAKASRGTLRKEERSAASKTALSRQAHAASARRTKASRSRAARKAAATRKK